MTILQFCKTAAGASLALAGLTVWVVAALSAMRGDGSTLWVIFGAVLAMAGMGVGFVTLRPRQTSDRDRGVSRRYRPRVGI